MIIAPGRLLLPLFLCSIAVTLAPRVRAASYVVAASNSLPNAQKRADVVCDGTNDAAVLMASLRQGSLVSVEFDDNAYTTAYSAQSVEWLAGDYFLNESVVLPQVADTVLFAQGTILHYNISTGDAVVITGSLRSKFHFGTIWSGSSGAALAAKDRPYTSPFMPNIMSEITWQGLQAINPTGTTGYGFHAQKHFVVNKITGFDIRGFSIGVWCDATGGGSEGTIDTNWWWLSYVRGCGTNIKVDGGGGSVNSQQWYVNVDASIAGAVAVQTGATDEWWRIIMGDVSRAATTRSIILDADAAANVLEITPALWNWDGYENNAGAVNNIFLQVPQVTNPNDGNAYHLKANLQLSNDGPPSLTAHTEKHKSTGKRATLSERLEEVVEATAKGLITAAEATELRKRILAEY
jgi:hypothetical protein